MISGIVVARVAGPTVLGVLSFATSYVLLFEFITGIWGPANIKMISEGKKIEKCLTVYSVLQIVSIFLFVALVTSWYLIQKYFLNYTFESKTHEKVIFIILAASVITLLLNFHRSTFTAQLKQLKANTPQLVNGVFFHIGRIIVVLFGYRAIGLAFWRLAGAFLTLPITIKYHKSFSFDKWDNQFFKNYVSYGFPFFLIVLANSLIQYFDKILLQHYTNSTEVGYYAAAFALGGYLLFIGAALRTVFFPYFTNLIANNKWSTIKKKVLQFQEFNVIFLLPLVGFISLISEFIIVDVILGQEYVKSVVPFQFLIFSTFVMIVNMAYINVSLGMGQLYLNSLVTFIKLAAYMICLYVLISPDYFDMGAVGVALNILIVNLIELIIFYFIVRKRLKASFNTNQFLRYMICIIPFIFLMVTNLMKFQVLTAFTYVLTVYLLFFITKLMNRTHVKLLIELADIKKFRKEIKSEKR
jgi:O-antigen/teichoic acid export membrane protein